MPSTRKSKRTLRSQRSPRSSVRSLRQKTRRTKTVSQKEILDVLQRYFTAMEAEIRQINPTYVAPTAEEFLAVCAHLNSMIQVKSQTGGALDWLPSLVSTRLQDLAFHIQNFTLQDGVALAVGTWDTPCNAVFMCISIAAYAAGAAYYGSRGDPPKYLYKIYAYAESFVRVAMPKLLHIQQTITDHLRRALEPRMPTIVTRMTAMGISAAMNAALNERVFRVHLACALLAAGVASCSTLCPTF